VVLNLTLVVLVQTSSEIGHATKASINASINASSKASSKASLDVSRNASKYALLNVSIKATIKAIIKAIIKMSVTASNHTLLSVVEALVKSGNTSGLSGTLLRAGVVGGLRRIAGSRSPGSTRGPLLSLSRISSRSSSSSLGHRGDEVSSPTTYLNFSKAQDRCIKRNY
jgi:hypothetical protein